MTDVRHKYIRLVSGSGGQVMVGFRVDVDGSVDAAVALEARLNGQLLADQGSFFSAKWAPDWSLLFAGFDGDKNTVGHND